MEYIRERHAYYLESPRCIADDIRFILRCVLSGDTGNFSALCQKTVSYGRTAGNGCLTVYEKSCVCESIAAFLQYDKCFLQKCE